MLFKVFIMSKWWVIIVIFFYLFVSSRAENMNESSSPGSLDAELQNLAFEALNRPLTGKLYKVAIPASLSGIEASVVRLRSGSFWFRGVNYSHIEIPSRVVPTPFVQRFAIVYQNLGSQSSSYYKVPGYSMSTPVLGFAAYDATNLSSKGVAKLNLTTTRNRILIRFPRAMLPSPEGLNSSFKCVSFDAGMLHFSEMAMPNVCATRSQGHFCIVAPIREVKKRKDQRLWKWLGIGFAFGFAGLVIGGLVGGIIFKFMKRRRIKEMEKQAEESEALGTVWIGTSKMPSARVIRTQPVLEHGEVPQ
ncbi:hypothetical protein Scep_006090 [Stephania cephalantha]|uniref:Uncharacterized protein n=1 Tax=Stephania cephalantha TaxID=152367 RepID=A0AAP0K946_9MAGN